MRIPIRTSKWAIWSRRLFSLAVPVGVFAVLLHRSGQLDSDNFLVLLAAVWGIAALAIVFALIAFVRLWYSGDRGWGRALGGFFGGLALLTPLAAAAVLVAQTPFANDITTAAVGTPPLRVAHNAHANPLYGEDSAAAFAGVAPRYYPLSATDVFGAAKVLAEQSGWDIRLISAPASDTGEGEIDGIATTWLGWRDEVVLKIAATDAGTRVDMRSASFVGRTDLGVNGRRIADFLKALDERLGQPGPIAGHKTDRIPSTKGA